MPTRTSDNPVRGWCHDLERRLRAGEPGRAEEYLGRAPALDPEDAVELVYTEFVGREERGDAPDPAEYLTRFPGLRLQLEEQFLVHRALHDATAGTAPRTGQRVGPYELVREIGRGSRGAVFVARDTRDGREVAVKLLLSGEYSTPDDLALFRQEAAVLARLDHPNLIGIFESGVADGRPYLALEYVPGPTLAAEAARFRDPAAAAELVEALARAVHHAHTQGVIHRDLKPGNILLSGGEVAGSRGGKSPAAPAGQDRPTTPPPNHPTPKITDFGLARLLDARSGRTRTGDIIGTLGYMAPEQAAGTAHHAGPPADVYALGAILYELLTGRVPFGPDPTARTLYEVLHEPPVAPRRLVRAIPRDLETVCLKCLEKHPDGRYPSALALADDLARFRLGRPVAARPIGTGAQIARWAARRPSAAALAAVSAVAAVGLVGGMLYHTSELKASLATTTRLQGETAGANEQLKEALSRAEGLQKETTKANRDLKDAVATADDLRAEANAQKKAVERQFDEAKRGLYALQLAQLPALWPKEPVRARSLLTDATLCPPELRDFTWQYFTRQCSLDERWYGAHPGATPTNPNGGARAVAFLPNGVLVSGGGDGFLRYWEPWAGGAGKPGRKVRAHATAVTGVVALPDGKVVTAGPDRAVKVWAVTGAKTVQEIKSPAGVNGLAAAPDGARLAGACEDGVVRVWETATGTLVAALDGHDGPAKAVAFTPDGKTLVSGGNDFSVRVWDAEAGAPVAVWFGHEGAVIGLAVSPTGRAAVSTGEQGDVRVWNLRTGTSRELRGHLMPVRGAAYSPTGDRIATGGNDTYLKVWDAADGQELTNLMRHRAVAVAFSPDGRWVGYGADDGKVGVYRLPTFPPPARFTHPATIAAVVARPGGGAVTVDADGEVRVWDAAGADPVARFTVPRPDGGPPRSQAITAGAAPAAAVSPDGTTLAVGAGGGTVVLWDLERQAERGRLVGHTGNVLAVAFHPDRLRLVTGGADGTLRVWPLSGDAPPQVWTTQKGGITCVACSADGRWVAAGGEDHKVRLWDGRTGEPGRELEGHTHWVLAVAFDPAGQRVASGSRDRTVRVWNVDGSGHTEVLAGYTNWVTGITYSPDGKTLATASGHHGIDTPGEVKLCDPAAGYVRAILADVRAPIAFTTDGRRLYAGVRGGVTELVGE